MKVLILAGGFGTRLKNIINDKPKPMAPINNIPFLEYQILQLKRYNLPNIVLCIGYLGDKIREYFGDGSKWNVNILYSHEKEPMGTGGALKNAEALISEDNFLAMNGDSFFDINLTELISLHIEKKALCTIALLKIENTKRYGTVQINGENKIKFFREKDETSKSGLINGGIYVFNKQIFKSIPENRKVSLEKEIFPNIIGREIYGLVADDFFIDIGTPEEYEKVQKIFQENLKCLLEQNRL